MYICIYVYTYIMYIYIYRERENRRWRVSPTTASSTLLAIRSLCPLSSVAPTNSRNAHSTFSTTISPSPSLCLGQWQLFPGNPSSLSFSTAVSNVSTMGALPWRPRAWPGAWSTRPGSMPSPWLKIANRQGKPFAANLTNPPLSTACRLTTPAKLSYIS